MSVIINSLPFLTTVILVKLLQQIGLIKEKYRTSIATILFNLVVPALIILLMQDMSIFLSDLKFSAMAFIAWFLSGVVGWIYTKIAKMPRKKAGSIIIGFLSFSIGIVVYPLVSLNYNNEVFAKVVLYDVIGHFFILMTLTYAVAIFYGENNNANFSANLKKIITSPIVISMIIGVLMSVFQFRHEILTKTLNYISSSFGLLVAALLALSLKLPKMTGLVNLSIFTIVKLISGIALGFLISWMFGITGDIRSGIILATASPVSVTNLVFAETEKLDVELVGQLISFTLIVSLIALPILIAIL